MSPRQRLAVIAATVAVLGGTFVVVSGSSDDDDGGEPATTSATTTQAATADTGTTTTETAPKPKPKPTIQTVVVVGGKPQGGIKKLTFEKDGTVKFRVKSDVTDHVHVHGYDLMKDVAAGGSATFDFPAKIDGRFEVELEDRGVQIAQLEVAP